MFSFFLGMAFHPLAQSKAQATLESTIGFERLPTIDDIASLPYIQAVVLEALRWLPVLPMVLPRRVMQEDEYMNYRIPKGSVILAVRTTKVILECVTNDTRTEYLVTITLTVQ